MEQPPGLGFAGLFSRFTAWRAGVVPGSLLAF